jgi:hypothetical protein
MPKSRPSTPGKAPRRSAPISRHYLMLRKMVGATGIESETAYAPALHGGARASTRSLYMANILCMKSDTFSTLWKARGRPLPTCDALVG